MALTKFAAPETSDFRPLFPGPIAEPFRSHPTWYTLNGRNAIYLGLKALGVKPGSTVLLPAYHCTALVEPVLAYGCRVDWYDVRRDLSLNPAAIEARLKQDPVAAFLCVHFFGFPAPVADLRRLCDRHGTFLLEDCTHGLFGKIGSNWMGTAGHASMFSFRKTAPVQDGGALVLPGVAPKGFNPELQSPRAYQARMAKWTFDHWRSAGVSSAHATPSSINDVPVPSFSSSASASSAPPTSHIAHAASVAPAAPTTPAIPATPAAPPTDRGPVSHEDPAFQPAWSDWTMSAASRFLFRRVDGEAVRIARARNYDILSARLAHVHAVRPFLPCLPEGVCPLGFPFLSDGATRADYALRRLGIPAFSFGEDLHPTLPRERFPDAVFLSERTCLLPVHQHLKPADLDAIVTAVERNFA